MVGNDALIQEFTLCLSDYFRYLGSGFSDTVRFGRGPSHLQNYIKIHQIRYPDRIFCQCRIAPELEDFEMLPMVPQTIVENIFKHVLGVQREIQITIHARPGSHASCNGMWLSIGGAAGSGTSETQ